MLTVGNTVGNYPYAMSCHACFGICGPCTYLCPTCHCFDISDEVNSAPV